MVVAVAGGCWWLLVVAVGRFGRCCLLVFAVRCCGLLLVVVGCCLVLLVVVGCCWLLLVVVGCCWMMLVVVGDHVPPMPLAYCTVVLCL